MTNPPFGFGLPGDDPSDKPGEGGPGGPGGFDISQLGAMLSQLGQMMSSASPSSGPVNYDLARKLAQQNLGSSHPVASVDVKAVREAMNLAEIWLDGATSFPPGASTIQAWSASDWVDKTLPTWRILVSPIADRTGSALVDNLPEEMKAQLGPMMGMLSSMGGMAFGSQLGAALAQLANEVLTSTDVGLPIGPDRTAAVLPRAVAAFGSSLGIDDDQVRLFLTIREAAHHRLYHGVPWLRDRIVALIAEYAKQITVDMPNPEELAAQFDPTNLAGLQEALGSGLFEPKSTPQQKQIAVRLETLLALIEGWVDTVTSAAIGERLPSASALQETLRRRRATGGPAEQTFATLIGIELRPRRLRAAAQLWRDLGNSRGTDGRDSLWSDYDLLPTADDLEKPDEFVARDKQFHELLASLDVSDFSIDKMTATDDSTDGAPGQSGGAGGGGAAGGPDASGSGGTDASGPDGTDGGNAGR